MRISDWSSDVCSSDLSTPQGFDSLTGLGVEGTVDGKRIELGNDALMRERKIDVAAFSEPAAQWRRKGASVMFLAIDGALAGIATVADPSKPSSAAALAELHAAAARGVLATGHRSGPGEWPGSEPGHDA